MVQKVTFNTLSSIDSPYSLQGITTRREKFLLNGEGYVNFNSTLENCIDVSTKGSSLFYLTDERLLDATNTDVIINVSSKELFTPIRFGTHLLTFNYDLSSSRSIDNEYTLFFSRRPSMFEYFKIFFIDRKYCYIVYSDSYGDFYMSLNSNGIGVMRRSIGFSGTFSPSGAQFFSYSLNNGNLALFKENANTGKLQQLVFNTETSELSAVDITSILTIKAYTFKVFNAVTEVGRSYNADYIQYNESNLYINKEKSAYNIPQNYLIYKNLDSVDAKNNIITLKNFQSNTNQFFPGNNLSLSSNRLEEEVRMRSYTSIYSGIDSNTETGLDLNYITYNESIRINPGINHFTTSKTFEPFTQININDTTLSRQGCFAGPVPSMADKIYNINNTFEGPISLLCTWLSGSITNPNSIWVDRYYYPEKFIRSSTNLNDTNNKILDEIDRNLLLNATVENNLFFDIASSMVFTPNTSYRYDRANYSRISFASRNDYNKIKNRNTYYKTINRNKGFVLSFDLVNYVSSEPYILYSKYNDIDGGITIKVTKNALAVRLKLVSSDINGGVPPVVLLDTVKMPITKRTTITVYVNSLDGEMEVFVEDRRVIYNTFTPAYYDAILYGPIFNEQNESLLTLNGRFDRATYNYNFVDNVFLSLRPMRKEVLEAYIIHKTRKDTEPFFISLPCGLKNNSDSFYLFNSLRGSTQSKSNAFNININNLNISDQTHLYNINKIITREVTATLPINKNINKVNFIQ